jgi:hypothetical protein
LVQDDGAEMRRSYGASSRLCGGGDPFLDGIKALIQKYPAGEGHQGSKGKKRSVREAMQQALDRPNSGRSFLDKIKSIVKAAEGGHLVLDSEQKSEKGQQGQNNGKGKPNGNGKGKG